MRVAFVSCSKSADIEDLFQRMRALHLDLGNALVFDLDACMCSVQQSTAIAHFSGQHFTAQRAVFSHPHFVNVCLSIVHAVQSDVVGRSRIYFISDLHGSFSDVVGRTVEHLLNSTSCEQNDAEDRDIRAVECYHWALTHIDSYPEVGGILTTIDEWLRMPFPSVWTPVGSDITRHFGWEAFRTFGEPSSMNGTIWDTFTGSDDDRRRYNALSDICARNWQALRSSTIGHPPQWHHARDLDDHRSIITALNGTLPGAPYTVPMTIAAWSDALRIAPPIAATSITYEEWEEDDGHHPTPKIHFPKHPDITMDGGTRGLLTVFAGGLPTQATVGAIRVVLAQPPPAIVQHTVQGNSASSGDRVPPLILPTLRMPSPAVIAGSTVPPPPIVLPKAANRLILARAAIGDMAPPTPPNVGA